MNLTIDLRWGVLLIGVVVIGVGLIIFNSPAAVIPAPANLISDVDDICNISALSEFYTAYKEQRSNCTDTTNLSGYTFYQYKPF
jgi:hypothetical protein